MKFELIITDTKGKKKKFDLWKVYKGANRNKQYKELVEDFQEMKVDIAEELLRFCKDEMEIVFRKVNWSNGTISLT